MSISSSGDKKLCYIRGLNWTISGEIRRRCTIFRMRHNDANMEPICQFMRQCQFVRISAGLRAKLLREATAAAPPSGMNPPCPDRRPVRESGSRPQSGPPHHGRPSNARTLTAAPYPLSENARRAPRAVPPSHSRKCGRESSTAPRSHRHKSPRRGFPVFALLHDVGMGAGEAGEIPEHGQLLARRMRRHEDGESHGAGAGRGQMRIDALSAAMTLAARYRPQATGAFAFRRSTRETMSNSPASIYQQTTLRDERGLGRYGIRLPPEAH
jgi:hypothetical protein